MRQQVYAGGLRGLRAASTAGGGSALSTTASAIALPDGSTHLYLTPRNFSTAVVAKVTLNPYLVVLYTADTLATATDDSLKAQDGVAATTMVAALTLVAGGKLFLIGTDTPIRGLAVAVGTVNSVAATIAAHYWKAAGWTTLTPSDGTTSGGATLAQDGQITWTVPADWAISTLRSIATPVPGANVAFSNAPLYWLRLSASGSLTAGTTLTAILALNASTAYAELTSGQSFECAVSKGLGGIGCVEALTDAGTANLVVNVGVEDTGGRFVP